MVFDLNFTTLLWHANLRLYFVTTFDRHDVISSVSDEMLNISWLKIGISSEKNMLVRKLDAL